MIVVRFRVEAAPGKAEGVADAFRDVVSASRPMAGVVSFDIGSDVTNPNAFVATEVFEDRAALEAQEELAEVARALAVLEVSLVQEPEATIFHVSSSEPWGD